MSAYRWLFVMRMSVIKSIGFDSDPQKPKLITNGKAYIEHILIIKLAGEVNTRMPEWVVGKIIEGLN